MIRRSRISVRPNVKPASRGLTGSRDVSLDKTQPNQTPTDYVPSEGSEVTAEQVKTDPPVAASEATNEKAAFGSSRSNEVEATRHGEDTASAQAATSTSSTSGPQRRKRLTALPNLAKPRASPSSSRTPKSPSKSPVKPVAPSEPEKSAIVLESAPRMRVPNPRASERHRQPKAKPTPVASLQTDLEKDPQGGGASEESVGQLSQHPFKTSQPDPVVLHEDPPECPIPFALEDTVVQQENNSALDPEQSQSDLLREKLKKLKSSSKLINSLKAVNDPTDVIRLARARKLRELLKKEMNKNKEEKKKPKIGFKERKAPKDHTKMTMRELIYYLPASNPMKSFADEEESVSEIVLPNSPKPTSSEPPTGPSVQEAGPGDAGREEEEAEIAEETHPEGEDPLMVPRVKVAEDGSLIIDEESLTVQVSRTNGPNPAEDRDPIFERGSTTTYSSFRKGTYTKPWSSGETDMFYLAISMVGTDFSMIGQLFPHRARIEIKNKFKKEERANAWRIDKAFKEKRRLDLEFFKTLMEQILKHEQTQKDKNKELVKLAKAQRTHRKPRATKREKIESSEGSDSDEVAGEKENEDLWNDEGGDGASKKRRRVTEQSHVSSTNDHASPQDGENEVSDVLSSDDRLKESDSPDNVSKSPAMKLAQLKGRPQRPTATLSQRCGNRRPAGAETKKSPKMVPVPIQEREKKRSSMLHELEDLEEEPDITAVQEQIFNKPTRSGRIPKLSQHVMQAVAEEDEEESSDQGFQAPVRKVKVKPGLNLKQGMTRRGKSKLVTLRASGTEDDNDEEDVEDCVLSQEDFSSNPEEENQAFVPMSLRSLAPVNSELVETVEELDISENVPDILGTSQNALCSELSFEQAEMPAGSVPCEHQLDLLVDVIEFLDPEHMEVCKEINNEAAQTLLTIGNSAQMIQTAEMSCTEENYISEQSLGLAHEEVIQEEAITETIELHADTSVVMSGPLVGEMETKGDLDLLNSEGHFPEASITTEQPIRIQTTNNKPTQDEENLASTSAPPSRRGHFSKPKPNVGQGLKTRRAPHQQAPQKLDLVQSSSSSTSTERDKNTTQSMQEVDSVDHTPQESSAVCPVMHPDASSERREEGPDAIPEKVTKEGSGSVSLLKRKSNDIITEESAKKERRDPEETGSHTQHTDSVSEFQERSDETSKPVRRYRGPKPKPNLTRTSRPTHTLNTSTTTVPNKRPSAAESFTSTFTPTKSAEESNVSQRSTQQEKVASNTESAMGIKEVTSQEENTRSTPEGNSPMKLSACVLEDTSADPTPDEPLFILSLTEIPPTFDEPIGFETESLPSTAVAELHSHGQSANESREACHLLITDALVPVTEEEEVEKKRGEGDEDKTREEDLKPKESALRSKMGAETQSQTEQYVLKIPAAERTEEEKEHPEKTRELPEKTRRAKLQVKPNPITRRSTRVAPAKKETPESSSEETTSVHIPTLYTRETVSVQEENMPVSILTTVKSDSLTPTVISDLMDPPQPTSQNKTLEEVAGMSPSQGIMGQMDQETAELTDASGSDSQDVSQITPVATSVPLTRPGRRPKGFLSFISSKNTQGPSGTHRGVKSSLQKPAVNTTRPERKRAVVSPVTMTKNPGAKRPSTTSASHTGANSEEEPTSVSEYFFSDIFTEVDEQEDRD